MELIEQIDGATHEVHGIRFRRTGSCTRCSGDCCLGCPHYALVKRIPTCKIYATRDQICEECSIGRPNKITHAECIKFPDHPWLGVLKTGKCGYSFSATDETNETKLTDLNTKWQ